MSRSWNSIASELLWKKSRVFLQPARISTFLNSLADGPGFAQTIKNLKLDAPSFPSYDPDILALDFIKILNKCSKLERIKIVVRSNIYQLSHQRGDVVPRLKRLHIQDKGNATVFGRQYVTGQFTTILCTSVWIIFSNTLTELDFTYLDNKFEGLNRFGGLCQYLSNFPNLKQLHCYPEIFNQEWMNTDLPLLLRSSKKLDTLTVSGFLFYYNR